MKKTLLLCAYLLLVSVSSLRAQTPIQVSGVVTEDGEPLFGVSVVIKGTTKVVLTDDNGHYTISVPTDGVLIFDFMGMKQQEIPVNGRTTIDVAMESDAKVLEDVVIIGYGSARKIETAVGSVSQVSAKKIENKPVANVVDALQGRVAGAQIFSSSGEPSSIPSIRIHGTGSLSADNTPLYIVDGIAVPPSAMINLNTNDFESVNFLKDASATSIYGSRAANGVVYIITKRGKTGDARINVRAQYGVSTLAETKKAFNVMNSKELLDLQLELGVYNMTQEKYNQLLSSGIDTKWYEFYFNNGATYQADLAIQGGSEKVKYYVSAGYFSQDGITSRSLYDRASARANLEASPKKWMRIGTNMAVAYTTTQQDGYTYQLSNNAYSAVASSNTNQPYYSPYDANGNERTYFSEMEVWNTNYLASKQPAQTIGVNFNGNAFVELTPIKGFTFASKFGVDFTDNRRTAKRLAVPEAEPKLWELRVLETFSRLPMLTLTNTLEYKFDFKKDHSLTMLAGQEGIRYNGSSFGMSTTGQPDERFMLLTNGITREAPTQEIAEYAYLSFFGTLNYGFKEKYFVDLSIRNDASSRFGPDNRNALFYSAGALWNMKQENFLKDVKFLSSLTAKVSFGTTGNSAIGNYAYQALIGSSTYDKDIALALQSAGNSNLGWESQQLLTIGAKAEFFRRIRVELDFYNRKTLDMLMSKPLPYSVGWTSVLSNIGSMVNRGVDVTLDVDVLRTKDWWIGFNATLNYNKNEVTELFYGLDEWVIPSSGIGLVVGRPVEFYMPVYAGVNPANGKQLWQIPGSDQVTEDFNTEQLQQMTGKPRDVPWSGGFELSATWKGFSAAAAFSWVGEKYILNNDRYFAENTQYLVAGNNQSSAMQKIWRKPGDVTDIPKLGETAQLDTRFLENASFMRLKNLTVGYNLPEPLLAKIGFFSNFRIFFTARNLLTFTNYTGADPEIDSNVARNAYPNTRQYSFGIDLTF